MNLATWTNSEMAALVWAVPLSAGTVAVVSPWGRRIAWWIGAIDQPNARKIHSGATPRLGGLSAAVAVLVCIGLWLLVDPTSTEQCRRYWGLFPGAAIMLLIGLLDDLYRLGPRVKLLFQFLAAGVICFGGICMDVIDVPLIGVVSLGWFGPVLTVFWIVSVTNALNFLDGLDGLAAGTAALASASFLLIASFDGLTSMLRMLNAALIGACVVLVVNNVRSPKSFLGDSGSLLLGVLVASTGILASQGKHGATRLCLPVIVLAVPLIDMVACVVRRFLVGRSVFGADRGHVHHMLLSFSLRPNTVAGLLCGATAVFGASAAIAAHTSKWVEAVVVLAIVILFTVVYRWFGYLSLAMWLHCRRANRVLIALAARTRRPAPGGREGPAGRTNVDMDLLPEHLQCVLDRIRRARWALGIEYIRVQRADGFGHVEADEPVLLEVGQKPPVVVTTHLYSNDRYGRRRLTVILGENRARRPARINAKEQMMMPLLTELAAALGPSRSTRKAPGEVTRAGPKADLTVALAGN